MQYLVNWRLFLSNKREREKFPAKLCFPQYFYMAVISIISHYYIPREDEHRHLIQTIIDQFYEDLQSIVNIIFPDENTTINLITPKEMKELLIKHEEKDLDIYYLESFIKDNDGKQNYQNQLLEESLNFYDKKTLNEIISYLCDNHCCSKEEIKDFPPPSKHYVTLKTNNSLKKIFINNTFGPNIWGPYYWKIFHALAEGGFCGNDKNIKEILKVLENYIHILPVIIPCELCRINYYTHIKPSKLPTIKNKKEATLLYSTVHAQVTTHTTGSRNQLYYLLKNSKNS